MAKRNRLANEKSPYLLQHADNPIDWYPWAEEAFETAQRENKLIFLSIGYSTCHWCHVMEEESFQNEEFAQFLNKNYIAIKVDREERPDIDHIYMTVCQAMNGSGGWPLTVLMLPNKEPFYTGTYFPLKRKFGRVGLFELLIEILNIWKNEKGKILISATNVKNHLQKIENLKIGTLGDKLGKLELAGALESYLKFFDKERGGFGERPKFPTPAKLFYLLRHWFFERKDNALAMVEKTLWEMRRGGIFDQIGFGFHRYSTDRNWLLPHFEKMLYDQALLSFTYAEAFLVTGKTIYKKAALDILNYVERDLRSQEGGFYSAEDADSEGEEGKFYIWNFSQVRKLLGENDALWLKDKMGLSEEGNFADEASGAKSIGNIFHVPAGHPDFSAPEAERWENLRQKLFMEREKRIHPFKDDKILTDWNGLLIASLALASRVSGEKRYAELAESAVKFIWEKMVTTEGRLWHRYRLNESSIMGKLEDYAFLSWGLIELYQATFEASYLTKAIKLQQILLAEFWDQDNGFFYQVSVHDEKNLIRPREFSDSALPAGNSVALYNLLRLGKLIKNDSFGEAANLLYGNFSAQAKSNPMAQPFFLALAHLFDHPMFELVISGRQGDEKLYSALAVIQSQFLPHTVIHLYIEDKDNRELLHTIPFLENQKSQQGRPTFYVCENFNCKMPTTDLNQALSLLGAIHK